MTETILQHGRKYPNFYCLLLREQNHFYRLMFHKIFFWLHPHRSKLKILFSFSDETSVICTQSRQHKKRDFIWPIYNHFHITQSHLFATQANAILTNLYTARFLQIFSSDARLKELLNFVWYYQTVQTKHKNLKPFLL